MPGLRHAVLVALGGDGQAVELPRQPDGEVADVDHLLDFAEPLGLDLAGLDGHQPAQRLLAGAQLFAQQSHQFAALGRRDQTPCEESRMRLVDRRGGAGRIDFPDMRHGFSGDRSSRDQRASAVADRVDTEREQKRVDLGLQREVFGRGRRLDRIDGHGGLSRTRVGV